MRFDAREDIIALTPLNPYDRFDDGRPKVPDELLEELKKVTAEEAWAVLDKEHNYRYQFEGDWAILHPDRVLVGRAITATMVPHRPDLEDIVMAQGKREGRLVVMSTNRWAYSIAGKNDVVVADVFGKKKYGTFIGDNLANGMAAAGATGLVVNGSIRDPGGCANIPNYNVFCRSFNPTGIRDLTMISLNGPTRIGEATVLPGDVVLGTSCTITFIPPHMVEEVIKSSKDIRLHDEFRQLRMREHKYVPDQVYLKEWGDAIEADYQNWLKQHQS